MGSLERTKSEKCTKVPIRIYVSVKNNLPRWWRSHITPQPIGFHSMLYLQWNKKPKCQSTKRTPLLRCVSAVPHVMKESGKCCLHQRKSPRVPGWAGWSQACFCSRWHTSEIYLPVKTNIKGKESEAISLLAQSFIQAHQDKCKR